MAEYSNVWVDHVSFIFPLAHGHLVPASSYCESWWTLAHRYQSPFPGRLCALRNSVTCFYSFALTLPWSCGVFIPHAITAHCQADGGCVLPCTIVPNSVLRKLEMVSVCLHSWAEGCADALFPCVPAPVSCTLEEWCSWLALGPRGFCWLRCYQSPLSCPWVFLTPLFLGAPPLRRPLCPVAPTVSPPTSGVRVVIVNSLLLCWRSRSPTRLLGGGVSLWVQVCALAARLHPHISCSKAVWPMGLVYRSLQLPLLLSHARGSLLGCMFRVREDPGLQLCGVDLVPDRP